MTSYGFGQEVATCILPKKTLWFGLRVEVLARLWLSPSLQRSKWERRSKRSFGDWCRAALTSLHLKSL